LGDGGIAPHILDFSTRRTWVVSFKFRPFYPRRNSSQHPLDTRFGGLQRRSGSGGEEKNSQPSPGIEPRIPNKNSMKLLLMLMIIK